MPCGKSVYFPFSVLYELSANGMAKKKKRKLPFSHCEQFSHYSLPKLTCSGFE